MIVTRFAPSPTGLLHAGNYRTALFAYLFARKNKGAFYLRIEDTDRTRSKKEYEDNIIESLNWLGLEWDNKEIYRQSEHVEDHKNALKRLIEQGNAYISHESGEDGSKKDIVRFRNPNIDVSFTDVIRGTITFNTTELGDFVIAKSLTEPLFHLAVVVDDNAMGITHIIRGEDHISNTPRQILIARALGYKDFIYAHIPLVLAPDRSKLSKRKGALPITAYRDRGFLPQAMINFMSFIGWNPGGEVEVMSKEELINAFTLERIQKSGAVFNEEKLLWFNKEYMKKIPLTEILDRVNLAKQKHKLNLLTEEGAIWLSVLLQKTITTLGDFEKVCEKGDFDYLKKETLELDQTLLIWKKSTKEEVAEYLNYIKQLLEPTKNQTKWTSREQISPIENIREEISQLEQIKKLASEKGNGPILSPLRYALTGQKNSPNWEDVMYHIGPKVTYDRITHAISLL